MMNHTDPFSVEEIAAGCVIPNRTQQYHEKVTILRVAYLIARYKVYKQRHPHLWHFVA